MKGKLEKSLSPMQVFSLAFGSIVGWGAFVMPGTKFLPQAGPLGTIIGMTLAGVIMFMIAINYSYMIRHIPSSGGEFIFASRIFGKLHGFICAWFLSLSYLAIVPLNATALSLVCNSIFPNLFKFGRMYSITNYQIYGGEILISVIALLFFAYVSVRGVKNTGVVQSILSVTLFLGILIVVCTACFKATDVMEIPFFHSDVSPIYGIVSVIAIAPWAFVGFDTIPQAVEEFNFSISKTLFLMGVAIFFGAFAYSSLTLLTALIYPVRYDSWVEYICALASLQGIESLPTFYAAYTVLGSWGLCILLISVISAICTGILGFYMATSRLLYSMGYNGVLPKWFSVLHEEYHTPYHAILFILIVSVLAPFFGREVLLWVVDMSAIGAAIGYGYTSAASYFVAKKNSDTRYIIFGAFGIALSVLFAVLLLIPIDGYSAGMSQESFICLFIWIILGVIFFKLAKKEV